MMDRDGIGGNMPPVFDTHSINIEDLFDEAKNHLDGEPIATPEQAEAVGKLRDMCRDAWKAADADRAAEKKPHDDASKAVQAKWTPLLAKAKLAQDTANRALAPWLERLDAEQRAIADKAREEAAERVRQAQEARQATTGDDLAARAAAEALQAEADRAVKTAAKLDKAKPQVAGGSRAIGLRTSTRIELTDPTAFARWAWINRRDALVELLGELASREGPGAASIPGITVHIERKAA